MAQYDQRIIDAILARAQQVSDPSRRNRYVRAALQTGIVESGLQNLNHGDADSLGWRQERASLYKNPTNITASVDRFFNEAAELDRGQHSWELAADVQRPAAQYRGRYHDVARQAAALLKGTGLPAGSGSQPTQPSPSGGGSSAAAGVPSIGDPGRAGDFTSLLGSLMSKPQPQQMSAPLPAPQFSAQNVLPQSFRPLTETAQQAPGAADSLSQTLGLLGSLQGQGPTVDTPEVASSAQAPSIAATVMKQREGKPGKVIVAASANRAGVGLSKQILRFTRRVAGIYGEPLTIGTGTNHNQYTVNGNVSNHWDGNGADIPARGQELIRMGQAALIAAGMPPEQARKQKGGLFNVGSYQIIFNTQEGGDHTDHLHAGFRGH